MRIPAREYHAFVEDVLENEHSIWTSKGFEHYILEQFPEVKELSSIKTKKQIKALASVKFLPPETIIATEGEICEVIHLVVSGKLDVFRNLKENVDKTQPRDTCALTKQLSKNARQGMKELLNVFGDLTATKYPTEEYPCKIGEESVLLGLRNTSTFVARSFVTVIQIDVARFFGFMREANPQTITDMKLRCRQKMNNMMDIINSKLRGEVLKVEMGFIQRNKRIIPEVEARGRIMVEDEVTPLDKKVHHKQQFHRSIQEANYFPQANKPARRVLKRIIEEEAGRVADFRPKIGLPARVTGALDKQDIIRLQELKQEFLNEKDLEHELFKVKQRANSEVHQSQIERRSILERH